MKHYFIPFLIWFAAAAAKSLQSCPTPSNPVDWWHVIYIKGFPSVSAVRNPPAKAEDAG